MATSFKKKVGNEFEEILKILSGELELREKEEKIKVLKKKAIESKKAETRKKIAEKDIVLEESDIPTKKVVQNIKLFEWEALERYEFKFEGKTLWIVLSAFLLFTLYLAILGQYWLMAAIISLVFFIYVAGTNKPGKIKHRITARGVDTGGKLYEWFMLNNFWFSIRNGQYFLILETKLRYPRAVILLLGEADKDAIFVLLQEKILYKDIRKKNKLDVWTYGQYIPLEEI